MTYHLGVDLGTTYTAAAVARAGRAQAVTLDTRSVAIPSVVYFGGDDLVVGSGAERRVLTEPSRVAREFKRRVGDPTPILLGGSPVPAELLMARLLDWVVRQVASSEGAPPASLAVTHPANWGEYKLDLLRQAIRHVGLSVDHLLAEPVAAATFYASERDLAPGSVVAVYDLGGGTFDAAVVRVDDAAPGAPGGAGAFRIVGQPEGIERLGGIDFDHAVLHHVTQATGLDIDALDRGDARTAAALAQLRTSCVEAKEALSNDTDVAIPVMLPDMHTTVRLTRAEFEAMVRPGLDETLVALRRAVASADVAVEDLQAVLLVGGSSRIPLIAQMVMAQLGRPAAVDARPKEAISLGAALVAATAAAAARVEAVGTAAAGGPATGQGIAAAGAAVADPAAPPATPAELVPVAASGPGPLGLPPPPSTPPSQPAVLADLASPAAGRSSRAWLVSAVVGVVAVGAVAAFLLTRDDGESPGSGNGTDASSSTTTDPDDGTTTTADDDPGTTTGSGETQLLPGTDWNNAARAEFVEVFAPELESTAILTGSDPEVIAGCIYDRVEDSGTSFDEFNEALMADDVSDLGPAHPGVQAMGAAATSCSIPTG